MVDSQWMLRAAILLAVQTRAIRPAEARDKGGWIGGCRLRGYARGYMFGYALRGYARTLRPLLPVILVLLFSTLERHLRYSPVLPVE